MYMTKFLVICELAAVPSLAWGTLFLVSFFSYKYMICFCKPWLEGRETGGGMSRSAQCWSFLFRDLGADYEDVFGV